MRSKRDPSSQKALLWMTAKCGWEARRRIVAALRADRLGGDAAFGQSGGRAAALQRFSLRRSPRRWIGGATGLRKVVSNIMGRDAWGSVCWRAWI